jgi:hypothetical protein
MNDPHGLRKKAARARWAATIRTEGGHEADLELTAWNVGTSSMSRPIEAGSLLKLSSNKIGI